MRLCVIVSLCDPLLDKQTIQDVPRLHPTGAEIGFLITLKKIKLT